MLGTESSEGGFPGSKNWLGSFPFFSENEDDASSSYFYLTN